MDAATVTARTALANRSVALFGVANPVWTLGTVYVDAVDGRPVYTIARTGTRMTQVRTCQATFRQVNALTDKALAFHAELVAAGLVRPLPIVRPRPA